MVTSHDQESLLPEVMAKVASLEASSLAAVHQLLLKLELAQLSGEIQDEADALRHAGQWEPELIEAAMKEHRQRHPYER